MGSFQPVFFESHPHYDLLMRDPSAGLLRASEELCPAVGLPRCRVAVAK